MMRKNLREEALVYIVTLGPAKSKQQPGGWSSMSREGIQRDNAKN
jgi:hypothetical protein